MLPCSDDPGLSPPIQEPLAPSSVDTPFQGTISLKAVPTQKYNLAARRLRLGGIESSYPIFARDNRTSPRIFNSSGGAGSRFAQEGRWTGNYTNPE